MGNSAPPPLPDSNRAWRTYLHALALLLPSLFFWQFGAVFLLPKLRHIWLQAGLDGSKIQWLQDVCYGLFQTLGILVYGCIALLIFFELRWTAWPRYRGTVIGGISLLFHLIVLTGITAIAVALSIAAPLLAVNK